MQFVAQVEDRISVIQIEQSGEDVFIRVDGLVVISFVGKDRVCQVSEGNLLEKHVDLKLE
jgi:hypothetical protein